MDDEGREQEAEDKSTEEEEEEEEVEVVVEEPKELQGYDSQRESPESPRELSLKMDEEQTEEKKPKENQEVVVEEPKELQGYDSQTERPESPRELSLKMDEEQTEEKEPKENQESLVKILRRRSTRIRWKDEEASGSEPEEVEYTPYVISSQQSVGSGMSLTLAESTIKSMIALPDEKIDMLTATSLLDQQASEIRNHNVNWLSYLQSQVISEEDFNFLAEFDCGGDDEDAHGIYARENLLRKNRHQAAMTFFNLLENISRDQTIQYILVMIDDMLQEDRKRVEIFHEYCAENNESVWRPFMNLLHRSDGFVVNMSARIITKIACWSQELMEKSDLHFYLAWLRDQLKDTGNVHMQSVARCLQVMLRVDEYRYPFVSMDGINVLLDVLQKRLNYQVQYQLVFCLWVLTFNPLLVEKMLKFNLIPILVIVLSNSTKDKVTRIILSLFRNLIEIPEDIEVAKEHCVAMVQSKVLKQLAILGQRKFDDEDIVSDIVYLNEKLLGSVQELSSFDVYSNQVKSGHLDWSPVHKSAKFWRENAVRLNEENHELLRMLINLLETSKDSLILSVACFDIGEYVRYYPKGKHVIDELGGKQLVMQLLGHDDPNVRYEALLAVQKLMVHSWEYLAQHLEEHQMKTSKSAISTSSISIK